MAQSYLKDPMRSSIGESRTPAPKVQQQTLRIGDGEKYQTLLTQLDELDGSSIIFVKTKIGTEELAMRLRDHGHSADAIHGDLRQKKREQVIRGFRNGRSRILVATDVVARGLDVPHIECVVNYDLPQCPEDYIHRIGRTGRAGAEGKAINLISGQDRFKWRDICRMMGHPCDDVQEPKYRSGSGYGKKPSPKPFGSSFKPKRFSNSRGRTH
jgi:superfamily II DNA/RNA helicase